LNNRVIQLNQISHKSSIFYQSATTLHIFFASIQKKGGIYTKKLSLRNKHNLYYN